MSEIRQFDTGANRDVADHKHDYEGFLSVPVMRAYGAYMHTNRQLKDGSLRDSDNWQNGIPKDVYMKSAYRHFMDWWSLHRGYRTYDFEGKEVEIREAICGLLFNAMGYLHESIKDEASFQELTVEQWQEKARDVEQAFKDRANVSG